MKFFKTTLFGLKSLFLLSLFLTSCIGDNFNFNNVSTDSHIKPEYKVPVVYANLSLKDLLPDNDSLNQFIGINDEGYLDLYYKQHLYSLTAAEYIDIPDQNFHQSLKLGETQLILFNSAFHVEVSQSYDYAFNAPSGMHLDYITFNKGQMHIQMNSQWDIDIDILLKLPGFTKNNGMDTLTLDFGNVHNQPADIEIDLDGYTIDLTKQESTFNILQMDYQLILNQADDHVSNSDDEIIVDVTLEDIGFESVSGYFGLMNQNISQNEIPFAFANNIFGGQIELENPQFNLFYQNSFGLPIEANFSSLYATSLDDEQTNINLPPALNPFSLSIPSTVGELVYDTVSLTGQNSNLFDVILSFPKSITIGGEVGLNGGVDSLSYEPNFMPDSGKFDITAEFRLPLSARFSIDMQDTVPFPASSSIPAIDQISQLSLNIGLDNGFPIDIGVQVYFADSLVNIIDSVFTEFNANEDMQHISGTTTNIPTHNDIIISLNNDKIQKLPLVKYMLVKAVITSASFETPGQYVQITDSFEIGFSLAFDVELDVNPSEFAGGNN